MENIIALDKLEIGSYRFDYKLDSAFLSSVEKTELLGGEVACKADLKLREQDYDLTVSVKGVVQVTCDRCLYPIDVEIDVEEEMDMEEGDREIDLNWLAYELIVVNLPLVHRHPDGECNPQMDQLLQAHLCSTVEDPETN